MRFFTFLTNFQKLVFDNDGVIAPLSFPFEGQFTIHFNHNYVERKKRGETFSEINGLKVMAEPYPIKLL